MFTPVNPSFTKIKVGFKGGGGWGSKLDRHVYLMLLTGILHSAVFLVVIATYSSLCPVHFIDNRAMD